MGDCELFSGTTELAISFSSPSESDRVHGRADAARDLRADAPPGGLIEVAHGAS
jgi:hypothetical protein